MIKLRTERCVVYSIRSAFAPRHTLSCHTPRTRAARKRSLGKYIIYESSVDHLHTSEGASPPKNHRSITTETSSKHHLQTSLKHRPQSIIKTIPNLYHLNNPCSGHMLEIIVHRDVATQVLVKFKHGQFFLIYKFINWAQSRREGGDQVVSRPTQVFLNAAINRSENTSQRPTTYAKPSPTYTRQYASASQKSTN
jgi:hypothetical protein